MPWLVLVEKGFSVSWKKVQVYRPLICVALVGCVVSEKVVVRMNGEGGGETVKSGRVRRRLLRWKRLRKKRGRRRGG